VRKVCGSGDLSSDGYQHNTKLFRSYIEKYGSGSRNFVRMTISDFEISLQNIGSRIQIKDIK
jgi:hypothetical protein